MLLSSNGGRRLRNSPPPSPEAPWRRLRKSEPNNYFLNRLPVGVLLLNRLPIQVFASGAPPPHPQIGGQALVMKVAISLLCSWALVMNVAFSLFPGFSTSTQTIFLIVSPWRSASSSSDRWSGVGHESCDFFATLLGVGNESCVFYASLNYQPQNKLFF